MISMMTSGYRRLIFALSLVAVASAGCSKAEPTKDELRSQAKAALAAEHYDKAEKLYREVLRLAPDDPTALRQLGIIYRDQGQLVQAYPLLKKAAELQPEDQELQLKLGSTLLAVSGERAQARDIATQVLEKQPGQEQALLILADACRTPEEFEDDKNIIKSLR
jgi:Flp pilus assembly protein TadD